MGGSSTVAIIAYLVIVNVLAFGAFGVDKSRAQKGEWRISERTLLLLTVIGGSVGAFIGMRVFNHKTRKPLFAIGVPIALVVHVAIAVWLLM